MTPVLACWPPTSKSENRFADAIVRPDGLEELFVELRTERGVTRGAVVRPVEAVDAILDF